ncbi:metal-sensitive transcriptional regulator [Oleiagrimonas sp.]|jgi:DNA-binding FrmR family transcriptional regulator|uniref:metal-sensitive transcriptional regulator n=1 Tax=Oleiagrimonas sp. TaxID=2010330 RepID=UPI0026320C64|nr:metal-sensitive transcriptional regulator [Oleiagrimonas sp.]MDA3914952.1 metal-sensitive transcriptional regulator [Oleiagrimonas sp.]
MKEKAQPGDLPQDEQAHRRRIITRLARIEGQVRGIQAMISDSCSCDQVAVQMTAARRALDKAFYEMLACSLNAQVTASSNLHEVRASTQDLARLLAKFG